MVYWDWLPSALSDNIDLLQFSAQTPFQLLKPLIVNARASLFNIECKIQALNLADSTQNRLKQFETKVGAATSAGLEYQGLEYKGQENQGFEYQGLENQVAEISILPAAGKRC